MRLLPARLSQRITLLMLLLFTTLGIALEAYWHIELEPNLQHQEQTKADLLMLASTAPLANALHNGNHDAIDRYIQHLLLLLNPDNQQSLIDGIVIEPMEGTPISVWQKQPSRRPFPSQTLLFSQDEMRIPLGNATIYYSSTHFEQAELRITQTLLGIMLFIAVVMGIVAIFLKQLLLPLRLLSTALHDIRDAADYSLPQLPASSSEEIMRVKHATDELLARVQSNREELESRIHQRTIALASARDAAEAANRTKSEFLANMSHEIRTPLNAIIGLTTLAQKMQLPPRLKEYIATINTSSDTLLRIVNDVLDLSKIEANKIHLEKIDFLLTELLTDIGIMFANEASARGITFMIDVDNRLPATLNGDPHRLKQILINLISNAIKFTEQGEVRVELSLSEQRDDNALMLCFSVFDSGIGIDESQCEQLFQPFTQADTTTTRRYGGTGLGLAISRRLVHLMGGELKARLRPEGGSCFWFTARLQATSGQPHTAQLADSVPGIETALQTGIRLLLVEDNAINRKVMLELLRDTHARIDTAINGREAVERIKQQHYDIVLMDLQMPEMGGIEATSLIRNLPGGEQLPIIAMTASAMSGDRDNCIAAGMSDYISKPIDADGLYRALCRWQPGTQAGNDTAPLDLNAALRGLGGKQALLWESLNDFVAEYRDAAERMRAMIEADSLAEAERLAHSIKGLAAIFLAATLHQAANEMEAALHHQQREDAYRQLQLFTNELERLIVWIQLNQGTPALARTIHKSL